MVQVDDMSIVVIVGTETLSPNCPDKYYFDEVHLDEPLHSVSQVNQSVKVKICSFVWSIHDSSHYGILWRCDDIFCF